MTAGRIYTEEEAALLTRRFGTKENKSRVLDLKIHTSIGSILLCLKTKHAKKLLPLWPTGK